MSAAWPVAENMAAATAIAWNARFRIMTGLLGEGRLAVYEGLVTAL
jgi:hypothetical protein